MATFKITLMKTALSTTK